MDFHRLVFRGIAGIERDNGFMLPGEAASPFVEDGYGMQGSMSAFLDQASPRRALPVPVRPTRWWDELRFH